jgi:chromosome segregation ATPase
MSSQRKQLSSTTLARDDGDFQLKRVSQEKESALLVAARTQTELGLTQDKMLALDASLMQATERNEALQREVALLTSRLQGAEEEAAGLSSEHQALLEKHLQLDQRSREQEFSIGQLQEQCARLGDTRQQAQTLSAEQQGLRREHEATLQASETLSRQAAAMTAQLQAAVAERDSLSSQLAERTSEVSALQSQLSSSLYETSRLEELVALKAQSSSALQGHQASLGDQVASAALKNSELEAELRLVNRRLFDAESKVHQAEAALLDTQQAYSRCTASLLKTEQALADLGDRHEGVKSLLRRREEEVGDLSAREDRQQRVELEGRRELRLAVEEREAALKSVRDLKLLLKNLEGGERDSAARLKRCEARVFELQGEVEKVGAERDEARVQLRRSQGAAQELQEAMRALDADRDELQNQLDDLADEESRKQQVLSGVHQKAEDLTNLVMQRDKLIEGLRRDKEHARAQLEGSEARLRAMSEENCEVRRLLALRQNEVGAAGEDLMLMTRENQSLTTELASAVHERDRLRQKVAGYAEQVSGLEHSVRALELERGDLLETYRTCLQERRKLEVDLGVMSESKARLARTINELRGESGWLLR